MPTRMNRYYNNPAIGQAFSNLASIFEPPDPTEILAYAQAEKVRQENQGLASLYGLAGDPNADPTAFDRAAIAAGRYAPNQSYYAVGVGDATDRRGQDIESSDRRYDTDVGAQTTLATNANTVRGNVIGDLYGPLSQGQVRPAVPDDVMGAIGMPGVAGVAGAPKPMSETEVEGQLMLDAITQGMVSPKDAADAYTSQIPVEQIVGEGGDPEFARRGNVEGAQPYINPGSQMYRTYRTPSGQTGTATTEGGVLVDHATRQPLPQGTITGDVTDAGSGALTASTNSDVQKTGLAINDAKATVQRLGTMIAANPGSMGLAGRLRGTVQDVIATGDDLARQWGGQIAEMQQAAASNPELAALLGPNGFDPSIPAIEMQGTLLAFQIAKVLAGGDRVSNQQFDFARRMVGDASVFANTQSATAKLREINTFLDGMSQRRDDIQAPAITQTGNEIGGNLSPEDAELFGKYGIAP